MKNIDNPNGKGRILKFPTERITHSPNIESEPCKIHNFPANETNEEIPPGIFALLISIKSLLDMCIHNAYIEVHSVFEIMRFLHQIEALIGVFKKRLQEVAK